jgi:hypothetical protein
MLVSVFARARRVSRRFLESQSTPPFRLRRGTGLVREQGPGIMVEMLVADCSPETAGRGRDRDRGGQHSDSVFQLQLEVANFEVVDWGKQWLDQLRLWRVFRLK